MKQPNYVCGALSTIKETKAAFHYPDGAPMIVTHRGDWSASSENSLDAVRRSIRQGVDMVEADVQKTKDGFLILMHDSSVDRMTNGRGRIWEMTLDEIRALRLLSGNGRGDPALTDRTVPTLEDVLQLIKGAILLNLDKCWPYREEAYALLERTDTVEQVVFKSTAPPDEVADFLSGKRKRPEYICVIDLSDPSMLTQLERIVHDIRPPAIELIFNEQQLPLLDSGVIRQIRGHSRVWVNAMWGSLCGGLGEDSPGLSMQEGWGSLLEMGVNMIQTDHPRELLRFLRQKHMSAF